MNNHRDTPDPSTGPNDPTSPREIENPGDPGFPVLQPPEKPALPGTAKDLPPPVPETRD